MKKTLKKQSLHYKKEMVPLLDITKHPCETRNVEIYIVNFNYKQTFRSCRFMVMKYRKQRERIN